MKKKKTTSNPKKQVNKSQKKGKKLGGGVGEKNGKKLGRVNRSSQDCYEFLA